MPRKLTDAQVEAYRRDGYLFPVPALSADRIALCRQRLDAIMVAEGGVLMRRTNQKPLVDFDPEALTFHSRMVERTTGILYAGASQRRDPGDDKSLAGRS